MGVPQVLWGCPSLSLSVWPWASVPFLKMSHPRPTLQRSEMAKIPEVKRNIILNKSSIISLNNSLRPDGHGIDFMAM